MSRVSFSMVNEQLNKMRQEGVAFDLDKFLDAFDFSDADACSIEVAE